MNDIESIRFELARYREQLEAAEKQGDSVEVARFKAWEDTAARDAPTRSYTL